ncbi:MAG: sugar transferase [Actinobacteria bacterium]|nr:sugar transferase [Actinomycetota bacterium]
MTPRDERRKRAFDLAVGGALFIVALPVLLAGALAAALSTRSHGFFVQARVGRHGEVFKVVKLRTMRNGAGSPLHVTIGGDVRITRVGRFLRRSRLDELPQLINVLHGSMSLVGPRPDVADALAFIDADARAELLSVRPGLTGPASLAYMDEEFRVAAADDPVEYFSQSILPHKVALNLEYVRNWSVSTDLRYLVTSLLDVASYVVSGRTPRE